MPSGGNAETLMFGTVQTQHGQKICEKRNELRQHCSDLLLKSEHLNDSFLPAP